jgi:hypothetical protein
MDRDVEKCKKILKAVDETKGSVQGQLSCPLGKRSRADESAVQL